MKKIKQFSSFDFLHFLFMEKINSLFFLLIPTRIREKIISVERQDGGK